MNQYYNYKKWRLARHQGETVRYSPFRYVIQTEPNPITEYDDKRKTNATRSIIDRNAESENIGGQLSAYDPYLLNNLQEGVNRVLHNLRYVTPSHRVNRPVPYIDIRHPSLSPNANGENKYSKQEPSSFSVWQDIDGSPSSMNDALSNYAGNIFHNILAGYRNIQGPLLASENGLNTHNNIEQAPFFDQMEEAGIENSLSDIPEHSMFHPRKINVATIGPKPDNPHRKSGRTSPFQQKLEDLGLILAHRGAEAYKKYLKSGHPGTLEQFLEETDKDHPSEKESMWHSLLLHLVKGLHLPE
jgi:hypothetical protein